MSGKPVWMETWHVRQDGMNADRGVASETEPCVLTRDFGTVAQLTLAAAAPQLVRALLALEWPRNGDKNPSAGQILRLRECPCCLATWPDWDDDGALHAEDCDLDATLTLAGFPDQTSRDEARKLMAEAKR